MCKLSSLIALFLASIVCYAQNDTILATLDDTTGIDNIDSLHLSNVNDTAVISDNSLAIELIRQSTAEEMENHIRLSILTEQLQNAENTRQKKALEKQLSELIQADSLRKVKLQHRIDSLKLITRGMPVTLMQDTIYFIYTNFGSITASERATLNSEKIYNTARIFSLKSDSLIIAEGNSTSDIMYRDLILASVTDADAMWLDTTRENLAEKYKDHILQSIAVYQENVGLMNILKIIGSCLLVIVIQILLFKGVKYLFNHVIRRLIISRKGKWFKGFKIKDLEILDAEKETRTMLAIAKGVKYLIYGLLLYLCIPLIFSIFPPTQRLAETLFNWVYNPIKSTAISFLNYLPNIFKIGITVLIMHYILKFLKYITREIESGRLVIPGFYNDWAKATFNIVRIFIYAFTLVLIFPYLPGSDSAVFQGVSVFMGIVFSLGSTGVISNLIAGMVITYMRPFIKGDRIKIGETFGDVIEKTPFVIRVLTPKNEVITVPNSTVLSSNVINYSVKAGNDGLIINTVATIGYDVAWEQINELLIGAALKTAYVERKPQPFVLQTALNDFTVSYQINAYTKEATKQAFIYSELHKHIQEAFRDAGVELMSPNYQAVRDGNALALPKEYKPEKAVKKQTKESTKDDVE
ncbi:MAG: mechanosensitive ion channel family protein [Tannerella sp.]|jgi:small-conductance mechanosensitive channel|nr:mechanosensitive ion channel family protein [Tannerella sp.]